MNMGVYTYLFNTLLSVLLGIHPEAKLLGHMISLFLIFGGNAVLIIRVTVHPLLYLGFFFFFFWPSRVACGILVP